MVLARLARQLLSEKTLPLWFTSSTCQKVAYYPGNLVGWRRFPTWLPSNARFGAWDMPCACSRVQPSQADLGQSDAAVVSYRLLVGVLTRGCLQIEEHNRALAASVEAIQARRATVLEKWKDFKELAGERRSNLEKAQGLQEFLRNADDMEQWIEEKMKIATDESYKDPTNMQVCVPHATLIICVGVRVWRGAPLLPFFFFFCASLSLLSAMQFSSTLT